MSDPGSTSTLLWILLVVTTLALAVGAVTLRKIVSIHLSTFELRERLASSERELGALFAQVQSLLALERLLSLPEALPAMRGWAGSPDFLLQVARRALDERPAVMLECSSGVSTVVLARCAQLSGHGHVFSLEHDAEYAEKTRQLLRRYGLDTFATVLHAPLVERDGYSPWYDEGVLPATMGPAELLVIDGPPAGLAVEARFPALPRLMTRLAERCTVMLDDAGRPDELRIVERWRSQWPAFKSDYLPMEKGLAILTRGR